jgi:hypothetical protein
VSTDVSEEHIASIFRVEEISSARNSKQAGGKQNNLPAENPDLYRKQKVSRRLELGSHWLIRMTE